MKWVFSAFVVFWSLRAIEGRTSADLWPNDVFTKLTPQKSRVVAIDTQRRPVASAASIVSNVPAQPPCFTSALASVVQARALRNTVISFHSGATTAYFPR